jgi:hypothetical protein
MEFFDPSLKKDMHVLDLLRAVSKFVETVHWKEALKILKLAVTRSSTLVAPPSSSISSHSSSHLWEAHTSFAEAEVYFKKGKRGREIRLCYVQMFFSNISLPGFLS